MSRIDLSKLPEPVRRKLQERLDRLPAELREKLLASLAKVPQPMLEQMLERGSPMLDKLLDSVEKQLPASASHSSAKSIRASAPIAPGGLYNKTVQRGDNLSLRFVVVVLILAGVVVMLYRSGLLAG